MASNTGRYSVIVDIVLEDVEAERIKILILMNLLMMKVSLTMKRKIIFHQTSIHNNKKTQV